MYPEVVSGCSGARASECSVRGFLQGVSGSSVRVYRGMVSECGCTDLRARGVRVSRAGSLVNAGLDLVPDGACISFIRVFTSSSCTSSSDSWLRSGATA